MAGESGRVAEVVQQEGEQVLLWVPMAGFPQGFKLRPGEKIVLVNDDGGPTVRPLVRSFAVAALEEEAPQLLKADDRRFALQESTIWSEGASAEGQGGPYDVFVVDAGSAGGPEQVLAVRPARRAP